MKKIVILIVFMFVAACSSKPSQFYMMNAMHPLTRKTRTIRVIVGPVNVAPYLQRSQIVTRLSQRHLHLAEYHRWAEPLRDNIADILRENLKVILHTAYVFPYSGAMENPSGIRVSVSILRFDTTINGFSVLKANWWLISAQTGKIIEARSIYLTSRVALTKEANYDLTVAAMNRNLQRLSYAIGKSVIHLH